MGEGGGRTVELLRLRLPFVRFPSTDSVPLCIRRRCHTDFRLPSSAVCEAIELSSSWTEALDGSGFILRVELG